MMKKRIRATAIAVLALAAMARCGRPPAAMLLDDYKIAEKKLQQAFPDEPWFEPKAGTDTGYDNVLVDDGNLVVPEENAFCAADYYNTCPPWVRAIERMNPQHQRARTLWHRNLLL